MICGRWISGDHAVLGYAYRPDIKSEFEFAFLRHRLVAHQPRPIHSRAGGDDPSNGGGSIPGDAATAPQRAWRTKDKNPVSGRRVFSKAETGSCVPWG